MRIVVLGGDGIGPEVTREALKVLDVVFSERGIKVEFIDELIGGASIDRYGYPITDGVIDKAKSADAVLLGAVGGPKWDDLPVDRRPESGLLRIRKELGLWANIRPIKVFRAIGHISPLKEEKLADVDFVVVRELSSDIYFGEPRVCGEDIGLNTALYRRHEVERIARLAFELAARRKRKVSSVDKANVLEYSEFWRRVVSNVALNFPDIKLEHIYVDAAAYYIVIDPARFDVILTSNLFGDILSDEAGGIIGSLGLCPSASLGDGPALYEPVHGSAPDIAGKGIANPIAAILSAALLLRYSAGMEYEAMCVELAVERTLKDGFRTKDIARGDANDKIVSTQEFGDEVVKRLRKMLLSNMH